MMKFLKIVLLFSITLFVFACNKNTHSSKQVLRLNLHSEPPTLDPRKASDDVSSLLSRACFEGLMSLDAVQQPEFAVAERYTLSEDQKTYTFYLRKTLWWDGKPVTAHDFETTWKTILDPTFPSPIAFQVYILKNAQKAKEGLCSLNEIGVKAVDDSTLEVTLEYPSPFFLKMLATSPFLPTPTHLASLSPNWANDCDEQFVGNGPFKMKSWRHQNELVLEKNKLYWDQEHVGLDQIHFSMVEDENTSLSLFEAGEFDWLGYPFSSIPLDALPVLRKNNRVESLPLSAVYYYIFNTKQPPFDNALIRRAFALAIDRQGIVQHVLQTGQVPATGIVPPYLWGEERTYFDSTNLEEARRLFQKGLEEMGKTAKTLPQIKLVYNRTEGHHKIAQAIQQQWFEAFGIRAMLENLEWKVFLSQMRTRQFQVARMGWIATVDDPLAFLDQFCNHSDTGWNNETFNGLIQQAKETLDPAKRLGLLKQAESVLIAEMPIAPIYFYTGNYMKQSHVHGMQPSNIVNINLKTAFLEKR